MFNLHRLNFLIDLKKKVLSAKITYFSTSQRILQWVFYKGIHIQLHLIKKMFGTL